MALLKYTKLDVYGNEFILIDNTYFANSFKIDPIVTKSICNKTDGVGADQILILQKPKTKGSNAKLGIINADGTIAEMCGNGIIASTLYLSQFVEGKKEFITETLSGRIKSDMLSDNTIRVGIGKPKYDKQSITSTLALNSNLFAYVFINTGVPHAVFFENETNTNFLKKCTLIIENHKNFHKKTNIDFVKVLNNNSISIETWERGVGFTKACGTGACASAIASILIKNIISPVTVIQPGGKVIVEWEGPKAAAYLSGKARLISCGEINF